jgi:hypothetical protein
MAKAGLGAEPGHPGGLGEELGRGQRPAAGQAEQRRGQPGDLLAELTIQLADLVGERADRGDLVAADADLHAWGRLRQPGRDATHAGTGQPAGGAFQVGVELMQVPA